jgi:hypothetical protein
MFARDRNNKTKYSVSGNSLCKHDTTFQKLELLLMVKSTVSAQDYGPLGFDIMWFVG